MVMVTPDGEEESCRGTVQFPNPIYTCTYYGRNLTLLSRQGRGRGRPQAASPYCNFMEQFPFVFWCLWWMQARHMQNCKCWCSRFHIISMQMQTSRAAEKWCCAVPVRLLRSQKQKDKDSRRCIQFKSIPIHGCLAERRPQAWSEVSERLGVGVGRQETWYIDGRRRIGMEWNRSESRASFELVCSHPDRELNHRHGRYASCLLFHQIIKRNKKRLNAASSGPLIWCALLGPV